MSNFDELRREVEEQEKTFIFESFDSETALKLGLDLIEEALNRNNKIAIDISAFGRCLFHYTSNGNAPSNDEMLRRKKNTADYTGHSSLWAHYFLKEIDQNVYEKWALSPSEYAQVGGAFPIRIKNMGGPVGTVTVSGFDHTVDHGIIIDVLKVFLNEV